MAFGYPGNPAGGAGTSPAPGRRSIPAATLPADLDAANAASVDPHGFETAMDWLAFLQLNPALNDMLAGDATSFDGPANPTVWNDTLTTLGTPISGLDLSPTFAAASGFAVNYGAGAGHLYTSVAITPGESTYREIWWDAQALTHANPHATLPRIDLVTVTPNAPGTASTLAIVAGTAATPPLAPAVPSGSGAVFYVLIPPAAANSSAFRACRGMGRRMSYPFSTLTTILSGCEISWDYTADPTAASAAMLVGVADQTGVNFTKNLVMIDGEPLEWLGIGIAGNNVVSDSTADPFGTAASGSNDRPYYIYACGGRHNPLPSTIAGNPFLIPVTFCESTVAPNPKTGKPTGNLTVNGVTVTPNGAIYIGIGFVVAGTTRRRGCVMDNEMTYALNPLQVLTHNFASTAAEDVGTFTGACQPAISTKMLLNMAFTAPAANPGSLLVRLQNFPPGAGFVTGVLAGISAYAPAATGVTLCNQFLSFTPRAGAELWAYLSIPSGTVTGASISIGAMGFNHRVRRLMAGY